MDVKRELVTYGIHSCNSKDKISSQLTAGTINTQYARLQLHIIIWRIKFESKCGH